MKKSMLVFLAVLIIISIAAVEAFAAPELAAPEDAGPYEGTFTGTAYGDAGSSAPLTLDLTHRGVQVAGDAFLEEGLFVDAGICGSYEMPAAGAHIVGKTLPANPKRLLDNPTFDAGGFDLTVDFESNVSTDGDSVQATAKIDLPWFCGRDPQLTATLYRD